MTLKKFKQQGGILCMRSVLAQGGSYLLTIPREFIKRHGIKAGDLLPVIGGANLTILPPQDMDDAKDSEP
jgi:hypothetical protein